MRVTPPAPKKSAPLGLRGKRLALAAGGGVALAVALVVLSVVATNGGGKSATTPVTGVAETNTLLQGIPQQGLALGSPKAPITLEEFADMQCPYCAQFAMNMLPGVVDQYVRSGQVRIVFRPLAFIGDDSVRAARYVAGAGQQNKAWQLIDILYRNQGGENSGWASKGFVESAAAAVGIDAVKARDFANSDKAGAVLSGAQSEASNLGIDSTPSLVLRAGGAPKHLNPFDAAGIAAAIKAAQP